MLDAITLERRGVPAVAIGSEWLVKTTGRGMAKIQNWADFPIVSLTYSEGTMHGLRDPKDIEALAEEGTPQVVAILLGR